MQEYNSSLYSARDTKEDTSEFLSSTTRGLPTISTSFSSSSSSSASAMIGSSSLPDQQNSIERSTSNGSTASNLSRPPYSSTALLSPKRRTNHSSSLVTNTHNHRPSSSSSPPSVISSLSSSSKPNSPMHTPRSSPKRKLEHSLPLPPTPSSIRSNHTRNNAHILPVTWIRCIVRTVPTRCRLWCCQSLVWGSPIFRFSMLFLSMAVLISGYFSYDLPGITSSEVKSTLNLNNASFGALFSVYALPNSIMPLFSGAYFTKVGVWKGVLVISGIITLGIWLIAVAIAQESYVLLLLGRAIYGIGGDSIYVGIDVLATGWFRDTEIGLAYGIIQAAGQAGSFIAFYGVPSLAEYLGNWRTVYYVAAGIATLAFIALIIAKTIEDNSIEPENDESSLSSTDEENDDETNGTEQENIDETDNTNPNEWETTKSEQYPTLGSTSSPLSPKPLGGGGRRRKVGAVTFQRSSSDSTVPSESSSRSLIHDGTEGIGPHASNHSSAGSTYHHHHHSYHPTNNDTKNDYESGDDSELEKLIHHSHPHSPSSLSTPAASNEWRPKQYRRRIHGLCSICVYSRLGDILGLEHLLGLSTEFWLVFLCIIIYSSVFYTFLAFGNDFLQTTYGMNAFESGRVVGLISISSCILSPTSGLLLDKVSGRSLAAFIAMLLACISFFLLGFTSLPVVPLIGTAGIAYSILPSALYPIVAEVVPDESFTVVYAAVNAGVNMLLTVTVYSVGWISHITASVSHGNEPNEISTDLTTVIHDTDESKPNYYYVFAIFVMLTGIGTAASGYMLYLRWHKGTLFQKSELVSEFELAVSEEKEEETTATEPYERTTEFVTESIRSSKDQKTTKRVPIIHLQPHSNLDTDTVTIPLTLPSTSLTKETSFLPETDSRNEYNQNLANEYRHEHAKPIKGIGLRGRTILQTNPLPIPDTASSTVLADLSKHATTNLLRTNRGTVQRIRSVGTASPYPNIISGVGEIISSVPTVTAASTSAGLSGPVFIRNDGKVYSGLGLAQRMGHNIPMQVMDARHRGGFTRPTLGFPYPFQVQEKSTSHTGRTVPVPISGKRGLPTTTISSSVPGTGNGTPSFDASEEKQGKSVLSVDGGNSSSSILSKSYAGPYYLEQIYHRKNRRSRTMEPSSSSTIGTRSYIITPTAALPPSKTTTKPLPPTSESLASVLKKEPQSTVNVRKPPPPTGIRIEIPNEASGNDGKKEYQPLPSRSPP